MSGADMLVEPDTGEVTVLMSKDEAEEITLKIKQYVGVVCHLVKEAHDKQAWRAMDYPTWTAYCKAEFNVGKSRSYQLVKYAEVIALGTDTTGLPESTIVDSLPEGTARGIDRSELAALLEEAYSNLPADADLSTRRQLFTAVIDQLVPTSDAEPPAASDPTPTPEPEAPATSAPVSDGHTEQATSAVQEGTPSTPSAPDTPGEAGAVPPTDAAATGPSDGGGTSSATPVAPLDASPELEQAAERAAISADMVAARRLLSRDPARVVELMSPEDAPTWIDHKEDMAEWFHGFDAAMTARNQLRSV